MATEKTRLLNDSVITIPVSIEAESLTFFDKSKGLSLEELMPFQDDPWWMNLRKTFFLSFWLTLIIIFSTACILSIIEHGASCPTTVNIKTAHITNDYFVQKLNSTIIDNNSLMTSSSPITLII